MKTKIINYYTTRFGELWDQSLFDLVEEAINGVIRNSGLEKNQIDAVFFANMLAGVLENNLHTPSKIAEIMKVNIPIFRVEAACASGGIAFHLAHNYLQSGQAKTVLVIGAEKMSTVVDWQDRSTCVLFGDGAGAAVLGVQKEKRILSESSLKALPCIQR